jgi:hypothetical protein
VAVYEGARRTGIRAGGGLGTAPQATNSAVAAAIDAVIPRRRVRGTVRAGRRSDRIGIVLGAIVITFMLAFFWLAQSMRVSATGYEIDRLLIERDRLEDQQRSLVSDLNRLGREPAIRKLALDLGLGQLTDPIILEAK